MKRSAGKRKTSTRKSGKRTVAKRAKSSKKTRSRKTAKSVKAAKGGKAAKSGKAAQNAKTERSGKRGTSGKAGGSRQRGQSRPAVTSNAGSRQNGRVEVAAVGAESRPDAGALTGRYVYCIIPTREFHSFGRIGIGPDPADVNTVNYEGIAAVASDAPLEVYEPTRENVLAHERVNETVMREFTVIPMSFGTVFKTDADIVELMRSAHDAFRDVLKKMKMKVEYGLKVLWDQEKIIEEIEKQDENVRLLRREISSQEGSTYFARMQYGRLIDSLLEERSEQIIGHIMGKLSEVCVASRANKPIGDKMILNAAFLVSRDREADFDAAISEIAGKHPQLSFKYTGPWPPYNFVNIRLKLERATTEEGQ